MSYINYSMSERAQQAYESGEKPLSKWTKEKILEEIENILEDEEIKQKEELLKLFKKLTLKNLKDFLIKTSWHHTSNWYNITNFYSIYREKIEETTIENLNEILNFQKNKNKEKAKKEKSKYVTALVFYIYWTGTKKHPRKNETKEIIKYKSDEKIIKTRNGNKRLSSITILKKVEDDNQYIELE